jgi:two-component system, NtrC family, sensor kinase
MSLTERLFSSLAQANCHLLTVADLDAALQRAIAVLGSAIAVDHAYILESPTERERGITPARRPQWHHRFAAAPLTPAPDADWSLDVRSAAALQRGQVITLARSAGGVCQWFPIFVAERFWGILGFDFSRAMPLTERAHFEGLKLFTVSLGAVLAQQTQRQQQAIAMTESRRFQDLLETIEDWIWEVDEQGIYTYVSPQVEKLLHYQPAEVIGKSLNDMMRLSQPQAANAIITYSVQQRQPFARVETIRLTKAGRQIVMESNGVPFFDAQGEFKGYRGIDRDIRDRKAAEDELYQQNCLIELRATIDSILGRNIPLTEMLTLCTAILVQQLDVSVARIWITNPSKTLLELQASAGSTLDDSDSFFQQVPIGALAIGMIAQDRSPILTNDVPSEPRIHVQEWAARRGLKAFAGYPLIANEDVVGVMSLFAPHDLAFETLEMLSFIAAEIAEGIRRKQSEVALAKSEARLRRKAEALKMSLSKLRTTQAKLVQSEKMSSLGQLVAGVAHEINNPVNFIQGNVRYSQEYLHSLLQAVQLYQAEHPHPSPQLAEALDALDLPFIQRDLPKVLTSMEMGADRIQSIVATLKVFACLDETGVKPIDVQAGIDSALMLLSRRLRQNQAQVEITIERNYGDVAPVEGLVGHLNQAFMNILTNAIDALHEAVDDEIQTAPKITIKTTQLDPAQVQIEITDNAGGMETEVQKQIFDPFFTTKPIGQGTGLGLSTCYQIVVHEHGGQIECSSEVGSGTCFSICLPTTATARPTKRTRPALP